MKTNFGKMIKTKRAVMIVVLIILFCLALEIVSYYNSSKILYQSISQSFVNRAVDNARLLSEILEEKLIELELIAEEDDIRSMDWERQKAALLRHIDTLNVKRFRIADINGFSKATDSTDVDISDREFFKIAINGKTNISDVLVSKIDGSLIISCATPVKDYNNNIAGVLVCTLDFKMLTDVINNIKIGNEGYATLLNYNGVVVAHPKNERVLSMETIFDMAEIDQKLQPLIAIEKRKINGETGFGLYEYDGISKFQAFSPVQNTNWILGLTIPESEAFNVINSLRQKFILETIIFVMAALIVAFLILVIMTQKKKVIELQKNAEESNKHLAEMTEIDELKTEFFANITHELRTPINVIFGALQLFEYSMNNETYSGTKDMAKRIKVMKQNCFRLLRLINNLIDTTKLDAGYMSLKLKNDDIVQVIEEITLSVADYIKDKGIYLIFDTEIEEKVIAIDHDKIERIVLNLLSNATKFTNRGGGILVNIFDKGDKIVVSVKDSGIGIPEDNLTEIFERFRQVNRSLTRGHEGSGIGLSLVKSLVEMHGGVIYAKSKLGQGSEFIFELPVKVLPSESNNEKEDYYKSSQGPIEKVNIEFSDIYF